MIFIPTQEFQYALGLQAPDPKGRGEGAGHDQHTAAGDPEVIIYRTWAKDDLVTFDFCITNA